MKLSRNYLDAIATHWSRANLTTAKQAMAFAKKQIEEFQKGKSSKQKSKEVIPEWFKDRNKQQVNKQQENAKSTKEREREEEELAMLIQQFSENEQK